MRTNGEKETCSFMKVVTISADVIPVTTLTNTQKLNKTNKTQNERWDKKVVMKDEKDKDEMKNEKRGY